MDERGEELDAEQQRWRRARHQQAHNSLEAALLGRVQVEQYDVGSHAGQVGGGAGGEAGYEAPARLAEVVEPAARVRRHAAGIEPVEREARPAGVTLPLPARRACVENKAAQTSASWRSLRGYPRLRPASANQPLRPAILPSSST
jgi:hypothetical protein